jgi:hypothetical protein
MTKRPKRPEAVHALNLKVSKLNNKYTYTITKIHTRHAPNGKLIIF